MRPVHLADIEAATRVLLAYAAAQRAGLIATLIARADTADRYRKHTGKMHAVFGSGTLSSAAASYRQVPRPREINANVLSSFAIVISGLAGISHHHDL